MQGLWFRAPLEGRRRGSAGWKGRGVVALSSGLLLLLAGCGSTTAAKKPSSIPGPTLTLKLAELQNINTPTYTSSLQFAKLVKQYTDGKLTVAVYPNSELGSLTAQLSGTEAGTIAFYATPVLSSAVKQVDVLETPYLFPSLAIGQEAIDSTAIRHKLWSLFPAHGLTFLGTWVVGYSSILTKRVPITVPSDLKGLKIRVFDATVGSIVFGAMGADAVEVAAPETPTALSTGVVDGADDPASTMVGSDWYAGMGYIAPADVTGVYEPVIASTKVMNSLSKAERSAVTRALDATLKENVTLAIQGNTAALATMRKAGLVVTKPDIAAFERVAKSIYPRIEALFPGQVQALQSEIAKLTKRS